MDEEFEDDTERERQWLKKEFGENNEFFIALQGKLVSFSQDVLRAKGIQKGS